MVGKHPKVETVKNNQGCTDLKFVFRPDYIVKALENSCLETKIIDVLEDDLDSISSSARSIQRLKDITEENYNKKQERFLCF